MKQVGDSTTDRAIRVAVVVPTFNHGTLLPSVLEGLRRLSLPIVVIDDGSTDGTAERLARWIAEHPESDVHSRLHAGNFGKASALSTGFHEARKLGATHAVTIDADGQLDPADIPSLLEEVRKDPLALVLGSRPDQMTNCPARCRVGRDYARLALRIQCGLRLSDSQCGLRVYPLELFESIRCVSGGYSFESEVIARAAWAGCAVVEVPVGCRYFTDADRISHYRPWRDSLKQAAVHLMLLARAIAPWPHRRLPGRAGPRMELPRLRVVIRWLNPLQCWRDVRGTDLGRLELAMAMGVGALIGTTPFFGFHTALSAYVAWRLHLHPAAVIAGSQVSIPPLGIALGVVSLEVGNVMLTGSLVPGTPAEVFSHPWNMWNMAMHWLPAWMLGSVVVGLIVGAAVFGAMLVLGQFFGRKGESEPTASLLPSPFQAG
ncbi:MAG: DUF2062 domain-containing protein [Phycisphaerales bacterium]